MQFSKILCFVPTAEDKSVLEPALILSVNSLKRHVLTFQVLTHSGRLIENAKLNELFSFQAFPENFTPLDAPKLQAYGCPVDSCEAFQNENLDSATGKVLMPGSKSDTMNGEYLFTVEFKGVPSFAPAHLKVVHGMWGENGQLFIIPATDVKGWQLPFFNDTDHLKELYEIPAQEKPEAAPKKRARKSTKTASTEAPSTEA